MTTTDGSGETPMVEPETAPTPTVTIDPKLVPTIGRIVHVMTHDGSAVRPAMIVDVRDDLTVDLTAFYFGGKTKWHSAVKRSLGEHQPGEWIWPPRAGS